MRGVILLDAIISFFFHAEFCGVTWRLTLAHIVMIFVSNTRCLHRQIFDVAKPEALQYTGVLFSTDSLVMDTTFA